MGDSRVTTVRLSFSEEEGGDEGGDELSRGNARLCKALEAMGGLYSQRRGKPWRVITGGGVV